ncbi:oxidoreductase [Lasiosphaeria ovina]|uniref:Oxidoreductase n=1 Tax=Lasiosphaeria ovina TaxID=92902 RepID=A0AAE0N0J9_9PEZI|nr:oxidoreductase [Lasiosphaeria ovina]
MAPLNILIVGCGIAGPTLATFLLLSPVPATEKPRITIVERSSAIRSQGQNIDIRGVGVAVIRKLGLEAAVRAATTGEEGVQWVTKENHVWASIPASGDAGFHSPTSDIEIMRGRLAEICWNRSKALSDDIQRKGGAGIDFIFGDHLSDLRQERAKVCVQFAKSGDSKTYDLVVGADGLHSETRKMVWGADGEEERVKQLGMYGAFFSIPPADTDTKWRRCFHTAGRRVMMLRPDNQSGRTTVFLNIVNEKDSRLHDAARNGHDGVEAQKGLIKEYFHDAGWESDRVLGEMMETKDFYYETVAQVKMETWSKEKVVLLGDAGYCPSPMSGMGTTLAMYGAYTLAGALVQHPQDISAALAKYEQTMRPSVDDAQRLMPGMLRLMNPETPWGVCMVDTVIKFLIWTRLIRVLMMLKGSKTATKPVDEYGFEQLPDWRE